MWMCVCLFWILQSVLPIFDCSLVSDLWFPLARIPMTSRNVYLLLPSEIRKLSNVKKACMISDFRWSVFFHQHPTCVSCKTPANFSASSCWPTTTSPLDHRRLFPANRPKNVARLAERIVSRILGVLLCVPSQSTKQPIVAPLASLFFPFPKVQPKIGKV